MKKFTVCVSLVVAIAIGCIAMVVVVGRPATALASPQSFCQKVDVLDAVDIAVQEDIQCVNKEEGNNIKFVWFSSPNIAKNNEKVVRTLCEENGGVKWECCKKYDKEGVDVLIGECDF
ncbi:hypothetical protein [Okeania sp. SIO1I7]|uniref:hypothetical protein n=1 Tax=Okeania sp. SIO1I7 TaxID=2607772 RepID=UPI0013F92850|nr:hypothetical protein [Okeania sp. SIO1I7]NET26097.1 hypothetical protein [Okeania sp. SIO1I7]